MLILLVGHSLDILSRTPLWKDGLDYRHGTGHGIGSYLNVHEGCSSGLSYSLLFHPIDQP
jgi:Xaa-Pro aminopeptidase